MIIELKGVEFQNKGAELMLRAIIERISAYWPDARIAIAPSKHASFEQRISVAALQKLTLRKSYLDINTITYWLPDLVHRYLRRWGIVTEAKVDVILDAAGFAYSDQWGADLRLRHACAEISRLKRKGGAYIFMPQAMGPFAAQTTRNIIAKGFPSAALVCVRDDESRRHIVQAAGELPNLRQYKDFTNVVTPKAVDPSVFAKAVCIIPNGNMLSKRNTHVAWHSHYVQALMTLARIAQAKGLHVILLNHSGEADQSIINTLKKALDNQAQVINEADPLILKGMIAQSRLVICSRYHGCISALSSGVPCIGTSWSHKYETLFEEYGASSLLLSPQHTEEQLTQMVEQALEDPDLKTTIEQSAATFKQETERLWLEVKAILDQVTNAK